MIRDVLEGKNKASSQGGKWHRKEWWWDRKEVRIQVGCGPPPAQDFFLPFWSVTSLEEIMIITKCRRLQWLQIDILPPSATFPCIPVYLLPCPRLQGHGSAEPQMQTHCLPPNQLKILQPLFGYLQVMLATVTNPKLLVAQNYGDFSNIFRINFPKPICQHQQFSTFGPILFRLSPNFLFLLWNYFKPNPRHQSISNTPHVLIRNKGIKYTHPWCHYLNKDSLIPSNTQSLEFLQLWKRSLFTIDTLKSFITFGCYIS